MQLLPFSRLQLFFSFRYAEKLKLLYIRDQYILTP